MEKIVFVTGVTGRQGGALARQLIKDGWRVRGLTRNLNSSGSEKLKQIGVELLQGDMENIESLRSAIIGAYGVFSVQNFWEKGVGYEGELRQAKNLIKAAKEANIQHFVQASIASCDKQNICEHWNSKREIEIMVREAELPATMIRTVFYMDNFIDPKIGPTLTLRMLKGCLKSETKLHMIATEDIGALAAIAFRNPDQYLGQNWDVAGDVLTANQILQTYVKVTKKPSPKIGIPLLMVRMMNRDMGNQLKINNQGIWSFPVEPIRKIYLGLNTWENYCQKYLVNG